MMAAVTRRDHDGLPDRAGAGDHHRRGAVRLHDGRRDRDRRQADNRGSIEPGKWADLAVLSDEPA